MENITHTIDNREFKTLFIFKNGVFDKSSWITWRGHCTTVLSHLLHNKTSWRTLWILLTQLHDCCVFLCTRRFDQTTMSDSLLRAGFWHKSNVWWEATKKRTHMFEWLGSTASHPPIRWLNQGLLSERFPDLDREHLDMGMRHVV